MKTMFTFLFAICLSMSILAADRVTSVAVEGAIAASRRTTTPGDLQAIVASDFNLSNVNITCGYADGWSLVGEMPTSFVSGVTQTIQVTDGTTTENWNITVKKMIPASLPYTKAFSASSPSTDWESTTVGWAGAGLDPNQSAVARFGANNIALVVAFDDAPASVAYDIMAVGGNYTAGSFCVDASADGYTWRNIKTYNESGAFPRQSESYALDKEDRYVRWVYEVRSGTNMNIYNVAIAEAGGIGQTLSTSARTQQGLQGFTVKNGLGIWRNNGTQIQAVVAPGMDITKAGACVFEAASGYTFTAPTDFTALPTRVEPTNGTTTYPWDVYVRVINPSPTLPLEIAFDEVDLVSAWTPGTIGWASCGLNTSTLRQSSMSMDTNEAGVVFAFESQAKSMTYDLCFATDDVDMGAGSILEVLVADESANSWEIIRTYNATTNPIPSINAGNISHILPIPSTARYIKFFYRNRDGGDNNLNLNNIRIIGETTSINNKAAAKDILYQPTAGEIIFKQAVAKVEIYSMIGTPVATYNHPGNQISFTDGTTGYAIARITLEDGQVIRQIIKK